MRWGGVQLYVRFVQVCLVAWRCAVCGVGGGTYTRTLLPSHVHAYGMYVHCRPGAKRAKYLPAYTARALMLAAMHRAGVGRLGGTSQIYVREFAAAFPDEREWFTRLCSSSMDTTTVKEFFSDLRYTGRPEFWSMFGCLLLTPSMWFTSEWLLSRCRLLRRAMRSQLRHGLMRVPALCAQDVMDDEEAS